MLARLLAPWFLVALGSSLVLLFEFLNVRTGGAEGYHAPSLDLPSTHRHPRRRSTGTS